MLSQLNSSKTRLQTSIINMIDKLGSRPDVRNRGLNPENIPNIISDETPRETTVTSTISPTPPQNELNISEEVRKHNINVLSTEQSYIPSEQSYIPSEQCNISSEQCNIPCVHSSVMDLKLENMGLISTQQMQVFSRVGLVYTHKDYWSTIKLTGLQAFLQSWIDDNIPDTTRVNHVSTGIPELHETGSVDKNYTKTTKESNIQNMNIVNCDRNNTERESLIRKYTKWLTTSFSKNCGTESDMYSDIEGSCTGKTKAKPMNINGRDINVIAPSSF